MKIRLILFFGLALAAADPLPAQQPAPVVAAGDRFTDDQLGELLGPIALYPDALVAVILPASAVPSDVVLAARYLQGGGNPAGIETQSWDDSVVALAHYPDVVKWMDQNLVWTKQLGEAFVAQPADVMQSIQRLRSEAWAAGTLVDTPQQQVFTDSDNNIMIVPAQPDVLYVPRYDPAIVYLRQLPDFDPENFLTFGLGYSTGLWLTYDLDWGHRRIWVIDRHDRNYDWRNQRDWRRPLFPGRPGYVSDPGRHPWNPPPNYPLRPPASHRSPPKIVAPSFLPGTPPPPPGWRRDGNPGRGPDNPRGQPTNPPGNSRPGQFNRPVVQPLQGPVVQPFQGPVVQPLQPPQSTSQPPDRRGNPGPPQRERGRDDSDRRGRESPGASSSRPSPSPAGPGLTNGIRPTTPQTPPPRGQPPRSQPDNDDRKKDQDQRD